MTTQVTKETSPHENALGELEAFHAQAKTRYLATFLEDSPDIVGWNEYLGMLAGDVLLDPASLTDASESFKGTFIVSGAGITVDFEIGSVHSKIASQGRVLIPGVGDVDFQASVSLEESNGDLGRVDGVVQFFPEGEQRFYEDGPVGYLYRSGENATWFRPLQGDVRADGKYYLTIPHEDTNKVMSAGGLGWAYSWMQRLREAQRTASAQGSSAATR